MRSSREDFHISKLNRERRLILMDPTYQREGGVWSQAKQELFIDSLVNGYDIPKIYMHELDRSDTGYDYAVVDGKQRIGTVFNFLDGKLAFADDFKYSGTPCDYPPKPGDRFADLHEDTKEIVKECVLDVVIIKTNDLDEIEELFSRLNNGEKLNAAETRNAIGGRMSSLIRELAEDPFFRQKLGFTNRRYAHYEVACKLLYLERESMRTPGKPNYVDLKKKFLDEFVRSNRDMSERDATRLIDRVRKNLRRMSPVFGDSDIELSKQSYPQLMYLLVGSIDRNYGAPDLLTKLKEFLADFRRDRALNLDKDEDQRDAELAEFGRLMQQGTNDAGSMESRVEILTRRFLQANQDVSLKDAKRAFTLEERWVLWQRAGKKCEKCRRELPELKDLDGDHIIWHVDGGPTTLQNARALCVPCNRGAQRAS